MARASTTSPSASPTATASRASSPGTASRSSQKGFYTGRHPNGGHTGMYTYLDTASALGTTFELLESFDPNGEVR